MKAFELKKGLAVASFDTRIKKRGLPGSAAKSVMRKLVRKGGTAVDGPHSFWVSGTDGPLVDGEIDRAQEWGRSLATTLLSHDDARRNLG